MPKLSQEVTEWLTAARQSHSAPPSASARETAEQARFPREEHPHLRAAKAKTDLRKAIYFRNYTPKKPPVEDKEATERYTQLLEIKKVYNRWTLTHRVTSKGPLRTLELWWSTLLADCAKHVTELMIETGLAGAADKLLMKGDIETTNALSSTSAAAVGRKLHGVVITLLADHPLEPAPPDEQGEDAEKKAVKAFCELQLGMTNPKKESSKGKLQATIREVTTSLIRFRELLNHTIMYAMTEFCHKDTVAAFAKMQKAHQAANALKPANEHKLFTATPLIAYLREKCSIENQTLIKQLELAIRQLHRYNGETPADWLDRFAAPLAELRDLKGGQELTEDEAKDLWKETWGRNINSDEHMVMTTYKDKLDDNADEAANKWASIRNYADGIFDVPTMEVFLIHLQPWFKANLRTRGVQQFEPDSMVRHYNATNYKNLLLQPKDIAYDSTAQRKRNRESRPTPQAVKPKKTRPPPRPAPGPSLLTQFRVAEQHACTTPSCRAKGPRVFRSHTTTQCRAADAAGSGPLSKGGHRHSSAPAHGRGSSWGHTFPSQSSTSSKSKDKAKGRGRPLSCKFCRGRHPAASCPVMASRSRQSTRTSQRVRNSPQFQQRLQSYFTDEQDIATATRILHTYDLPCCCQRCLNVDCDGFCDPSPTLLRSVKNVKNALKRDRELSDAFRDAVHDSMEQAGRAPMAPINAESFLTHPVPGQDTDSEGDNEKHLSSLPHEEGSYTTIFANRKDDHWVEDPSDDDPLQWDEAPTSSTEDPNLEEYPSLASHSKEEAPADDGMEEDDADRYLEGGAAYFTLCDSPLTDESQQNRMLLDERFGIEVYSPLYSLMQEEAVQSRRSLICECTAKVHMPNGTMAVVPIKIDNCNSRMLAGRQFVRDVKSCYEYGIPPVRMKTTSKLPTTWKRDAGLLHYRDSNDVLCVSLVYVDYDNPDLILMDMSTMLDAQVDHHHHAVTSRDSGVEPLKRFTEESYHYKDYCGVGNPWTLPTHGPPLPIEQRVHRALKRRLRSVRRLGKGSTKPLPKRRRLSPPAADCCVCEVRIADSLDGEAYTCFVEGVSEASLRQAYRWPPTPTREDPNDPSDSPS